MVMMASMARFGLFWQDSGIQLLRRAHLVFLEGAVQGSFGGRKIFEESSQPV
jgi:hypothetical protein